MGRTVASFNLVLNLEKKKWAKFRKALKKEDQEILDLLWEKAKKHVQAAGYSSFPLPMEGILLAICIELMKEIQKLKSNQ